MATPGVAASARTRRRRRKYTPPQQPQRRRPGTAAKTAGSANMRSWWSGGVGADKPADGPTVWRGRRSMTMTLAGIIAV